MSALPEKDRDRVKSGWCIRLLLNYMFMACRQLNTGQVQRIGTAGRRGTRDVIHGNILYSGTHSVSEHGKHSFIASCLPNLTVGRGVKGNAETADNPTELPALCRVWFRRNFTPRTTSIGLRNMDYVAQQQNKRGKPSSGFIKLKERRRKLFMSLVLYIMGFYDERQQGGYLVQF
ncbi:hypothetical protein B0H14DRAFT_2612012 [Mycena olivaceomarginata]|nr:hypothetical protein B0H14DRAFT_2612012 [Mycena olivaceomarginata]